jgi:type II secretory pathway pseudopilin PulG
MQNANRPLPTRSGLRRRLRSRAAFTLIEVMMAFTILIAGLCGGLASLQSGFKSIDSARCSTLAAQIMQSQIERLRLLNWTDLSGNIGTNTAIPVIDLVPASATDIAGRFTLTQTIQPDPSRSGIVDIKLNVAWTNLGNIPQTRSFVTRYAKNGLYDYYFSRH